jgi:hypothetical protein
MQQALERGYSILGVDARAHDRHGHVAAADFIVHVV